MKSSPLYQEDINRLLRDNDIKSCRWFTVALEIEDPTEIHRLENEGILITDPRRISPARHMKGVSLGKQNEIRSLTNQIHILTQQIARIHEEQHRFNSLFNSKSVIKYT